MLSNGQACLYRFLLHAHAAAVLTFATALAAQTEIKLTASDAVRDGRFGSSLSVDVDTAFIGARTDPGGGINHGSVYVFVRGGDGTMSTWSETSKLTAMDVAPNDQFGVSVSLDGDTAVIGSFWDDDRGENSGSAYVFSLNPGGVGAWTEVNKLTAPDGEAHDWFGISASIDGDTIVVGAELDDDNGTNSGAAYVFSRDLGGIDNWGEVTKLTASDAAADSWFGRSVDIDGDTVIIGAWKSDSAGGMDSGSAYVFYQNAGGVDNWGEVKKLVSVDDAEDANFGVSLSLSGDTAVIGAYRGDSGAPESGSAHIFSRDAGGADNWGEVKKLIASDKVAFDQFGISVALDGETALIGSWADDDSGSAYVFSRNVGGNDNWGEVIKLTAVDAEEYDLFGSSVSIVGDTAFIGAYLDDDGGSRSGSVYVYDGGPIGDIVYSSGFEF